MSHVDEGTLHAYLDGELSGSERAVVDSHLAECATCRTTLADARALLERASALLDTARPVERPAPPLERLRRAPRQWPWRVRTSVAWAASIALALGIGYVLRNPTSEVAPPPAAPAPRVANNQVTAVPEAAHDSAATRQRRAAREEERPRAVERSERPTDIAAAAQTPSLRPAPSAHYSDSLSRKRELQNAPLHLEEVVVTGQAAPSARAGFAAAKSVEPDWPIISRSAARALLGGDAVGLPGLTVRTIRRVPGRDSTVVVEQALDSVTVIRFFQRPAGPPALVDSAGYRYAEGAARGGGRLDHMLARFVGGLRVEISGPVPVDSLNRLLEQVRPLP